MKALLLAAGLAFAGLAAAGEDSTHRWGAGGTGPAWYDTPCGLARFAGPMPSPESQRCIPKVPDRTARRDAVSTTPTSRR